LRGPRGHNLRGVDLDMPRDSLVVFTGLSGSGKSTPINDILANVPANKLNGARQVPSRHTRITGVDGLDKVVRADSSPFRKCLANVRVRTSRTAAPTHSRIGMTSRTRR
jgi:excinuclease UvrABC ATPase subunit